MKEDPINRRTGRKGTKAQSQKSKNVQQKAENKTEEKQEPAKYKSKRIGKQKPQEDWAQILTVKRVISWGSDAKKNN